MRLKISLLIVVLFASFHASAKISKEEVIVHYADIAHATYADALVTARALQAAVGELIDSPSEETLLKARDAWVLARVPYQQSETFRFGNSVVDDWEGQVNSWPLDEGLIDYVDVSYIPQLGNEGGQINIIANPVIPIAGEEIDVTHISEELLANMNEFAGSEANVATGYHAIEFLLWGQDLNGTGPGAGNRPYTDFVMGEACSNGNCDRRVAYLKAVTSLLVKDLTYMAAQWDGSQAENYRSAFLALPVDEAMQKILFGMGSLALGELAGERMKVALEANSPEDEHDCFSDNTHNSHYYNAKGIQNVFYGVYTDTRGEKFSGPSLYDLVKQDSVELASQADLVFGATEKALALMVSTAESQQPMKFDQMISEANTKGRTIITAAMTALVQETRYIESVAELLGVSNLSPDSADHQF